MSEIQIQKLAGVMGWPIAHSLSPQVHGFWLKRHGINGAYVPLAVSPGNFEKALRALPLLGFAGTNVTVPHKEAALKLVDEVDPVAERIGAVNTILVKDDGSLFGTNTDAYGFMENLKDHVPEWQPEAGPSVVLGAGGAARAVVASLVDAGVPEVRLVNRTLSRAQALIETIGGPISIYGWDDANALIAGANLVVNTTTLGMKGQPPMDLVLNNLLSGAVVTDIVYAPLLTPFLAQAKSCHFTTVDGLGMLLHQAVPGFARWFGTTPQVTDALRNHVLGVISGKDQNG